MLNGLKNILKGQREKAEEIIGDKEKYQQEAKVRHIKDIVKSPLNRLRIEFSSNFLTADCKNKITEEYIRKLHSKIETAFATDEDKKEIFAAHQENFEHFLATGDIKTPLNLKDEESQLFWGAALALYAVHPEMAKKWNNRNHNPDITKSTIWRRIASSTYMKQELQKHAAILENSLSNPDAKIVWSAHGYPNISYCFIPDKNLIIDDMLWTLVAGADAAAPAINHEIAHSQGTQITKSPRMEEIDKRQKELMGIMRTASRSKDRAAYNKAAKEATRLKLEFQYRFYFLDELENMYANRFAVNFGGEYDAAHLNELETDINVGAKYLAPKSIEEAEKAFKQSANQRIMHIKAIARNSFFANNELISPLKFEEWHALHLYPELLSGKDADGHHLGAAECFERIREICDKFEASQPSPRLKNLNKKMYQSRMTAMSKRRAAMVDEFFDTFVAPHMEELYKEAEKKFDEQDKQLQSQMQNQQQQSQQQENQQGQGSDQDQQQENRQGQGNDQDQQQENQQGQGSDQDQQQENQQGQGKDQDQQQENRQGQGSDQDQQQENQQGQGGNQDQQQENQQGQSNGQQQENLQGQGNDQNQQQENQQGQGNDQNQQQENQQGQGNDQDQQQESQQGQGNDQNQQQENRQGQGNDQNQQQENQQGQGNDQNQQQENQQGQSNGQQQNEQNSDAQEENASNDMPEGFPPMEQFELPDTDSQYRPKLTEEEIKDLLEKAENLQDLKKLLEKAGDKENGEENKDGQTPQKTQGSNQDLNDNEQTNDNLEDYIPQNDYPTLIDIDSMKKLKGDEMQAARFYREGNWDEYQKYIAQYANEIAQAKKLIAEIIKQNKLDSVRRGHEKIKEKMTKLPVQGGRTIDLQRHVALEQKLRRGDPNITRKDLERFRTKYKYSEDEIIKEIQIPQSNFGILIDGSGSMTGRPFENALAISCILYEAARSFKEINVYIYMMGQPIPLTVALPDDATKKIAERLESVRDGQGGCNDFLTPAIRQLLTDVSENMQQHPHVKSGFTHIFSITDGGNNDYGSVDVNTCIEKLLEKNEQITFDSFFVDGGWRNYTKPLIEKLKKQGSTQIDCVDNIDTPDKIPAAITEMLKKRMKNSQIKAPQTNSIKQKLINDALKSIKWR